MWRRAVQIAILAASAAASPAQAAAPAQAGLDLAPYRGQVVLVDFWASWCGPCAESFPWMVSMVERHAGEGLVVVAVNVDEERAEAERFLEGRSVPFQVVYDPEGRLADHYGLRAMPTSLLFDREGHLVAREEGFRRSDRTEYERRLVELLEGRYEPGEVTSLAVPESSSVRPWEKGVLARPVMQLDNDSLDLAFDEHIYFSKEATSGGRSFGGGGCGCN